MKYLFVLRATLWFCSAWWGNEYSGMNRTRLKSELGLSVTRAMKYEELILSIYNLIDLAGFKNLPGLIYFYLPVNNIQVSCESNHNTEYFKWFPDGLIKLVCRLEVNVISFFAEYLYAHSALNTRDDHVAVICIILFPHYDVISVYDMLFYH